MNRTILTIALGAGCLVLDGQGIRQAPAVSVKKFGAKGNGIADDTTALQRAFAAACDGGRWLHVPRGTYNISSSLVTGCDLVVTGDGSAVSILFQTVHAHLNHGITATHSLSLEDISINTGPVRENRVMAAVYRKDDLAPASGQNFTFLRFNSSGFNFAIDVAGSVTTVSGVTTTELLGTVLVRNCDLSVSTAAGSVSEPVNVRTAAALTVENNILTGDDNNDHAIYVIGVRKVLIQGNEMRHHGNSVVKLLTGGFGSDGQAHCDTGLDYSSWAVNDNTITDSQFAMAFYTYCESLLPALVISGNHILNMVQVYEGDGASVYIEAACASVMQDVTMSGNVFQNLGLGGTLLLSTSQAEPCPKGGSSGTIASFSSTGDTYSNWSLAHPGSYFAISSNAVTPNRLLRATVQKMTVDGQGSGPRSLNLLAFKTVNRR